MNYFPQAFFLTLCLGCGPEPTNYGRFSHWQGGGLYSGGICYQADGKCFVISSPASGHGDLWQLGLEGDWAKPIVESEENEIDPYSSKAGLLYFSRLSGNRYRIHSITPEGQEKLIVDLHDDAIQPVPLPDGTGVLFVRHAQGAPASLAEIWEKRFATAVYRQLTNNDVHDGRVSCFKSSTQILFCRDGRQVYSMDLITTDCTFICDGAHPVLSEDEKTIYVVRRREPTYNWDLWSHDRVSGKEKAYPFRNGIIQAVCKLPDGKVAAVFCDPATDRAGFVAVLDPVSGNWTALPSLLSLTQLRHTAESTTP